ncbi:hypothetical protein LTR10_000450 [Elasticomyces elasticus]|nr:hypothetical protein LTR10_000450 [Elasticomyces elasticus]KAK4980300.1 hypothetical protein LTR42_000607 [Elasticomyces elasticus]
MSSAVQASGSEKPEIYVWLVQKCDYDDGRDDEGRTMVCDVYADLALDDEDEDEAEEEKANSETGFGSHLNSYGCYERSHESDHCRWRDHYGNLNGESSFSVSVEQFPLKGKIPSPQTSHKALPASKTPSIANIINDPLAKKRKLVA